MKNFLFVMRSSPYEGPAVRETLDMIMTVATFDQPVRVLFLDDGVFQLKLRQQPQVLGFRPVQPLYAALSIFGVDGVWAEEESLAERGLNASGLILPTKAICRVEIPAFIASADIVVGG